MNVRIIKYEELRTTKRFVPFDCDKAIADYRGFMPIGICHANRIQDDFTLDIMLEAVDILRDQLLNQKKQLHGT